MKKIFSLFAAILFVGSMMAQTVVEDQEFTFGSGSTPDGWTVNSSNTHANNYLKISDGDYLQMTTADVFAENEVLESETMDVEVSCGTFSTWSGTKSVKCTVELRAANGDVLSKADATFTSLTNKEGAYKDAIKVAKPEDPSLIAYLRITFSDFTTGPTLRVKYVRLNYTTDASTVGCTNKITITKADDPANGTFILSRKGEVCVDDGAVSTVVTATPAEHYHLAAVTSLGEGETAVGIVGDIEDNSCTITGIDANTTIAVSFAEDAIYQVTWSVNGNEDLKTSVYEGDKPTFPATPAAFDETSTLFYGWATEAWDGKLENVDGKTVYTSASAMPAVEANVTYYAVFAKGASSGDADKFTLVETELPDWSGLYLIVNIADNRAMSGSLNSGKFGSAQVTATDKVIENTNENLIWEFAKGTGDDAAKYSVKNKKQDKYAGIGNSSTSASLNDDPVYLDIIFGEDSEVKIAGASERFFSYYASQTDFRTYAGTSDGVHLFKGNDVTLSDFVTTSSEPTALDNTNAEVKAEKFFRNGQLIIRKNGVEYNALGTQL